MFGARDQEQEQHVSTAGGLFNCNGVIWASPFAPEGWFRMTQLSQSVFVVKAENLAGKWNYDPGVLGGFDCFSSSLFRTDSSVIVWRLLPGQQAFPQLIKIRVGMLWCNAGHAGPCWLMAAQTQTGPLIMWVGRCPPPTPFKPANICRLNLEPGSLVKGTNQLHH